MLPAERRRSRATIYYNYGNAWYIDQVIAHIHLKCPNYSALLLAGHVLSACGKMTIVHHESQPSKNGGGDEQGGTPARTTAKHQRRQDRKHQHK